MKEEIVANDEILNIVTKIGEEHRTTKDLKKDYPNEIEKLDGALLNHMGDKDLKLLEAAFPDTWKNLTKN